VTIDATLTGKELLQAAAVEVRSWPAVSASRGRQVQWVAGEYGRALDHADHPLAAGDATARRLFRAEPVTAYLALARRGELRVRKAADPGRGSDNSEQTRIEVLGLLVTACGAEAFAQLPAQPDPPTKQPVAPRPRSLLRASLTALADRRNAGAGQIRMLAIGATVVDTGVRAGELCSRTVEDLAPSLEELRVVRRPQGRGPAQAFTELLPLSALSRAAHRQWLPQRQELLRSIGGTATALWVSLHANHHNGRAVPAGTPLQPRGLARAWTRTVIETNIELAGHPDWAPLPTRMEQLRRGVTVEAVPALAFPDAERAAELLADVTRTGTQLAAARDTRETRETGEGTTAELAARAAVRRAVREAWAEGIEHRVQLGALADAGLKDTAGLAAAGWEPVLLDAIDRAAGWDRARRKATTG
jgi:integrase